MGRFFHVFNVFTQHSVAEVALAGSSLSDDEDHASVGGFYVQLINDRVRHGG